MCNLNEQKQQTLRTDNRLGGGGCQRRSREAGVKWVERNKKKKSPVFEINAMVK